MSQADRKSTASLHPHLGFWFLVSPPLSAGIRSPSTTRGVPAGINVGRVGGKPDVLFPGIRGFLFLLILSVLSLGDHNVAWYEVTPSTPPVRGLSHNSYSVREGVTLYVACGRSSAALGDVLRHPAMPLVCKSVQGYNHATCVCAVHHVLHPVLLQELGISSSPSPPRKKNWRSRSNRSVSTPVSPTDSGSLRNVSGMESPIFGRPHSG